MVQNKKQVIILPGDNIGPEVTKEAVRILEVVTCLRSKKHSNEHIVIKHEQIGGAAIDAVGKPLPDSLLKELDNEETVAVFLGAVGGPKWDTCAERPEKGNCLNYITLFLMFRTSSIKEEIELLC
jgi:3-isopropylmalate dehydrogenase